MDSTSTFFATYRRALLGMLVVLIIGIFLGIGLSHREMPRDLGRGTCMFGQEAQRGQFSGEMMRQKGFKKGILQTGEIAPQAK